MRFPRPYRDARPCVVLNNVCQLFLPRQPMRGAEGGGDAARETLVPVRRQDPGEIAVRVAVEHVRRGRARGGVHPHVQRRVDPVGEAPLGAVDLKLSGANKLMDGLVAMGVMPQDQVMFAKMMMGMYAVPAGEDLFTSKIEFKEGGHILANGQPIK